MTYLRFFSWSRGRSSRPVVPRIPWRTPRRRGPVSQRAADVALARTATIVNYHYATGFAKPDRRPPAVLAPRLRLAIARTRNLTAAVNANDAIVVADDAAAACRRGHAIVVCTWHCVNRVIVVVVSVRRRRTARGCRRAYTLPRARLRPDDVGTFFPEGFRFYQTLSKRSGSSTVCFFFWFFIFWQSGSFDGGIPMVPPPHVLHTTLNQSRVVKKRFRQSASRVCVNNTSRVRRRWRWSFRRSRFLHAARPIGV